MLESIYHKALQQCADEQIHKIGKIQPHGGLVALSLDAPHSIVLASENIDRFLIRSAKEIIGQSISSFITSESYSEIQQFISLGLTHSPSYKKIIPLGFDNPVTLEAYLYFSSGLIVIELGNYNEMDSDPSVFLELSNYVNQNSTGNNPTEYFEKLTKFIRTITGYDSVMTYRFNQEWNGEVIAQSKIENFTSYLGLHFPASDIPPQARELYSTNLVRVIANIDDDAIPIIPDLIPSTQLQLDMSHSYLRSLSPIHMEYLRNMGIKASLAISIICNERLWGLVVCHHMAPKHPPIFLREVGNLISKIASDKVSNIETVIYQNQVTRVNSLLTHLVNIIYKENLDSILNWLMPEFQSLIDADGIIVVANGNLYSSGKVPSQVDILSFLVWARDNTTYDVFSTESLSKHYPPAINFSDVASGLMMTPFRKDELDCIIWVRQEEKRSVNWAGKPEKGLLIETDGSFRLTPRKSFEIWKEEYKHKSTQWTEVEKAVVNMIIVALPEGLVQKSKKENSEKINEETDRNLRVAAIAFQSLEGMVVLDANKHILRVNHSFETITGFNSENVIGQSWETCFIHDQAQSDSVNQSVWKEIEMKGSWTGAFWSKNKNSTDYYLNFTISSVKSDHNQITNYVIQFIDITEKKLSEDKIKESHALLQAIIEATPIRIFWKDLDLNYLGSNTIFAKDAGFSKPEDLIGKSDFDMSWKSNAILYQNDDKEIIESRNPKISFEETQFKEDGKKILIRTSKVPLFNLSDQSVIGVLGIYEDITGQKLLEEELKLASLVYRHTTEAMMICDEENKIIAVNSAFTDLTGYQKNDVLGKNPKILSSQRHDKHFYKAMWSKINSTGSWEGEIWNRKKNGEEFAEWLIINTIFKDNGDVHRRVALFNDITDQKRNEALIWSQANYDDLTKLPNRRLFYDDLNKKITNAKSNQLSVALLFMDLDRFKEINDTMGHDIGDLLLIQAADRIKKCIRKIDTLSRIGGDEFTIVVVGFQQYSELSLIASKIIDAFSHPFMINGSEAFVSVSIGISVFPNDAGNAVDLIKHADQAMYEAKSTGRNGYKFFNETMKNNAEKRIFLGNELRHAIKKNELEVYYQPIIDLRNGKFSKAEALLRWKHPVLGFVSPAVFIGISEENGTIHEIGDWVFDETLKVLRKIRTYDKNFQISINKSPVQFQSEVSNHQKWIEDLRRNDLPGSAIVIEITEGSLMSSNPIINKKLIQFRDEGIQVAIDDFGTGYSSLAYLKKFDIDFLKIDQSFTKNLTPNSPDFVLCEAIITMAHKLGLQVIAEGVETEEQFTLLKQIDCDFGQGYLFFKPMPSQVFEDLVTSLNETN